MSYVYKFITALAARISVPRLLHVPGVKVEEVKEVPACDPPEISEEAAAWRDALYTACSAGDLEAVKKIIDDEENKRFWEMDWYELLEQSSNSWMHVSAKEGNLEILKLLLSHKPNERLLHCFTSDQTTPLLLACEHNTSVECVDLLLKHRAATWPSDSRGFTALSWAVYHNNAKMAQLLVDSGMKLEGDARYVNIAEANRSYDIFPILAAHGCRLIRPETLNSAVKFREPARLVQPLLLCLDEETLMKKIENQTALHTICGSADEYATGVLRLLFHHFPKMELNVTDGEGRTPLGVACENRNYDAVRLLLKKGADVNHLMAGLCGGKTERSVLHFAVERRDLKLASHLLRHGATVDLLDSDKMTPLHIALTGIGGYEDANHAEITDLCRLLIHEYDASLEIRTENTRRTPLHLACKLKSATDDSWGPQFLELLDRNPRGSKFSVNAQDRKGKTALHLAARCVRGGTGAKLCRWLLEHGAMYSIRDHKGRTAGECAKTDEVKDIFKGLEKDSHVPSLMSLCAGVIWRERIIVTEAPDRVLEVLYPAVYKATPSAANRTTSTPLKLVESLEAPEGLSLRGKHRKTPKSKRIRNSPIAVRSKKLREEGEGVGGAAPAVEGGRGEGGSGEGSGGNGGGTGIRPPVFGDGQITVALSVEDALLPKVPHGNHIIAQAIVKDDIEVSD
ncbi:hypothetical protein HDV00_009500 [Rhizophlyctis rosea]|nr:hypothetical protein HDV00_009500 [Rhizophlyctis rosea]